MSFPQILGLLSEAGIESYFADLRRGVKVYYLPAGETLEIAEHGECRHSPQAIAAHTGLTVGRVRDCQRMMLKRGCIRRTDTAPGGAPCYVLP